MIYTHTIGIDGTEIPVTDTYNPSTDKEASNESDSFDILDGGSGASIFDMLENISKEPIIIGGASVVGVILLVIICVIVKKRRI